MPACPRDNQYSSLPPPGFTDDSLALKRVQLIELLEKVIDKCQREPQFVEQQPKQTDLLVSIAQFTLLSTPISPNDKRDFLNNIVTIAQDLLIDENQVNNDEITLSTNSSKRFLLSKLLIFILSIIYLDSPSNEDKDAALIILPSNTPNNDVDGDFSLNDLANEYLQNEPTPASSNDEKLTPRSEFGDPDLTPDDRTKNSPSTNVLLKLLFTSVSTKPQLESILFTNRLSSHDAADNADCIWKDESSSFGQMFCTRTNEIQITPTKRISTCLLDYSLYERLTRLVNLLPKQCIRNSVQQLSIRPNGPQQQRSQRPNNNNNQRPSHRPSFQQNSSQAYHMQRFPPSQNPRQYMNPNYSNQQGNMDGYFVDRRSQQQQQNRYPPPLSTFNPQSGDYQNQQKGPPKNNSYGGGYQPQKKKQPTNNQQASNQRGTKKGSGNGSGGKCPLFVSFYFSFIRKSITKKNIYHVFCLTNR